MLIVPPSGPSPNTLLVVGEAPGDVEAQYGKPFVGPTGVEQNNFLQRYCGLSHYMVRMTNVVQEYTAGNPNPTPEQIKHWTPHLLREVEQCNPRIILAVGAFAAKFFLGDDIDLFALNSIPHRCGEFDSSRVGRAPAHCVIIPTLHPAFGLRKESVRTLVMHSYKSLGACLDLIRKGREIPIPVDVFAGRENYQLVTGAELATIIDQRKPRLLALDTEGTEAEPEYVQISIQPGESFVVDCAEETFFRAVEALQKLADSKLAECRCQEYHRCECGTRFIIHNAPHDVNVARAFGLYLERANIFDTMYGAFVRRFEPQGLKPLAWRRCGMRMEDYSDIVGPFSKEQQIQYLIQIAERTWPKLSESPRAHTIERRAKTILKDIAAGKVTKDGPTDPKSRIEDWDKSNKRIREIVAEILGPIPEATLKDVRPIERAIFYAGRDTDATFRYYNTLIPELIRDDLYELVMRGMATAPYFINMQYNGMPVDREFFEELSRDLNERVNEMEMELSENYYGGEPFNVRSPDDTRALLDIRHKASDKVTGKGEWSTAKPAIEHLRWEDEAFELLFDARELRHLESSFVQPILQRADKTRRYSFIRCQVQTTRTHSRRLATSDPNLLNIPTRYDEGKKIRYGFRFADDSPEVLTAHDLAAIEMSVMAHESQDPLLLELFRDETRDFHKETAMRMFRLPSLDAVDRELHRVPAKTTSYGIINGQSGRGLYEQFRMQGLTDWTEEECYGFIDGWLEIYHHVKEYMARVIRDARKTGEVRDHWKMPRFLPGLWDERAKVRRENGRFAVSQKIQPFAQGMIQNSQAWLNRRLWELRDGGIYVKERLQVHDELNLSCFERDWPLIDMVVTEALTKHSGVDLSVPVRTEGRMSRVWAELK